MAELKPIHDRQKPPPPSPAPVLSAALHYAVENDEMSFAGALTETLDFLRTYNDRLRTERDALLRVRDDLAAENATLRAENARLRTTESTMSQTVADVGTQALRERERCETAERFAWFWFGLTLVLAVICAAFVVWK